MADGNSKRAWEIIKSHRNDACHTNNRDFSPESPVAYEDLVDGWRNVLLPSLALLHDECDRTSVSVEPDSLAEHENCQLQNGSQSPVPDYQETFNGVLATLPLDPIEAPRVSLFQLHPSKQVDPKPLQSTGMASLDCEREIAEAEDLLHVTEEMLSNDIDLFMDIPAALQAVTEPPLDGALAQGGDKMQEEEEFSGADVDSLTTSLAILQANIAHCNVEQCLWEGDLETTAYGEEERFVLYPDITNQSSASAAGADDDSNGELEKCILEFVEATNNVHRNKIAAWTEELSNAEEGEGGEEESPSPINMIPDEILLRILSYIPLKHNLTGISLVCKRWYILSTDPSLWQHVYIPSECWLDPHWLGLIASRSPLLKTLSLRGGKNITQESLSVVGHYCPQLTHVDFGFCNISASMLEILANKCPNIDTVNFEGCECVNSLWMKSLCQLKKLKDVNISYCTHLLDEDIIYMSENLSSLVSVCIDGNSFLSDECVHSLCTRHRDSLVKLSLDGAESTDLSVEYAVSCPKLTLLTISFSDTLTNRSVDFLQRSTGLLHLQIRKNKLIEDKYLISLFHSMSMQHLRYLDLTECLNVTDDVVRAICKRCPYLVTLMLQWCWTITDVGVECIVETLNDIQHLDLLGLDVILGSSFDQLPVKLPKLVYLNLAQCNKIDDNLIMRVVQRMPQLTAINFYHEDFREAT